MKKLLLTKTDLEQLSDILISKLQMDNATEREYKGYLNQAWIDKHKRLHEIHHAICDYLEEIEMHPDRIYEISVTN